MKTNVLAYTFKVVLYTFFNDSCDACGSGMYCQVEQWAQWGTCNATCGGGGLQMREKMICCDPNKYNSLKGCLHGCNIPFSWWQTNATAYKSCGKCQRGGTFDIKRNNCICPSGYGGSCCEIRTTLPTTIKTTTTTTKPTTKKTTTIPTTTTTTTKPTTTRTTTKPTTTKTTTIPTTTKTTTIPTTTTRTTKPTTTRTTTIPTTTRTTTIPTTTKATTIPTMTKTTTKPTTTKTTTKPTTTKTTTKPRTTTATTIPTAKKTTTKQTITKTTTMPSATKTIQTWAIAVMSVSCLGIVLVCCCCLWCLVGSYQRKDRVTKFKSAEEKTC